MLSIPENAVLKEEQISCQFLFDTEPLPTTDDSNDCFVFSPVLVLEPHDFSFKETVSVRFPFTATMEGWILRLMREDKPGSGWEKVLSLDTDTREVTQEDPDLHCNYDVNTRMLSLDHFCKFKWCGHKKSSESEKILACLLLARMDSSGMSCNFALILADNCDYAFRVSQQIFCFAYVVDFLIFDLHYRSMQTELHSLRFPVLQGRGSRRDYSTFRKLYFNE